MIKLRNLLTQNSIGFIMKFSKNIDCLLKCNYNKTKVIILQ